MIEWSLEFDTIHRIEHTSRADFVGVLVEPPTLLQWIGALTADELIDVERARGRTIHALTPCYCKTRPVTSTHLLASTLVNIDNGRMGVTKPGWSRSSPNVSA